jgi:hypothetical protein
MNGSSSQGDVLTGLTIVTFETEDADLFDVRPRIEVATSTDEGHQTEIAIAGQKLEHRVHDEISRLHPPDRLRSSDRSNAAITLSFRAIDRRRRAVALAATRTEAQITIDGTSEPFLTLTTPSGRWVAVRHPGDLTITIAAHDLDPTALTLESVPNPATRLLGPEPEDR